jgi:hypothetical protein
VIVAHIFGLPVEETMPQIVPAGIVGFLIAVRRTRARTRRWAAHLARWLALLRQRPNLDEVERV